MSRFVVKAFATGLFSIMGHNPTIAIRDFTGEVSFEPDAPARSWLQMRIRADSLEVTDDISNKDRREMERAMKQDVLHSGTFPEIAYESSAVSATPAGEGRWRVAMNGNLSLCGATRPQPVSFALSLTGGVLRGNGEFVLSQASYGIKPVSVAGGTLKLKDELKFTFDVVARKQE